MNILNWILNRLKERSTWTGIIALITAAGVNLSPELAETIIQAGVAVVGVLFMATADKTTPVTVITVADLQAQLDTAIANKDWAKAATLQFQIDKAK